MIPIQLEMGGTYRGGSLTYPQKTGGIDAVEADHQVKKWYG